MPGENSWKKLFSDLSEYIPQLSVDCVVFGFHSHHLKVLLMKSPNQDVWSMPGGFVRRDETVEQAARRVLLERTGVDGVYLQQFRIFSDPVRNTIRFPSNFLEDLGCSPADIEWLTQRFVTVGFYALVEYTRVTPTPDVFSEMSSWWDLEKPVMLMMDHKQILDTALETMQLHLNYEPIGLNLLPEKFTIPELQKLYEAILGKKLDRRNFQRKIHSYRILNDLNERKSGGAHKAPSLYSFNPEKYDKALKEGLKGGW